MWIILCLLAPSKILESVVEGEEKEKNSSDESAKPLTKEEEMSDLKMETPELKVNECLNHYLLHGSHTPCFGLTCFS